MRKQALLLALLMAFGVAFAGRAEAGYERSEGAGMPDMRSKPFVPTPEEPPRVTQSQKPNPQDNLKDGPDLVTTVGSL